MSKLCRYFAYRGERVIPNTICGLLIHKQIRHYLLFSCPQKDLMKTLVSIHIQTYATYIMAVLFKKILLNNYSLIRLSFTSINNSLLETE